eukprot:m.228781 g.228781  ORF g.228781 m.228781 type:complete len:119 (-) comp15194_c0_seq2:2367-2723(-)
MEQQCFVSATAMFCSTCGTMLPSPGSTSHVTCLRCKSIRPTKEFEKIETVTQSRPYAFQKPKYNTTKPEGSGDCTIDEKCPKCGRAEMTFKTAQLRSADEGQTIFYSCKCGYRYAVNS